MNQVTTALPNLPTLNTFSILFCPPPWLCIRMFLWSYVKNILLLLLSSRRLLASMGRGLFALLLLPAVSFLCSHKMLPHSCISQLYSSTVFLNSISALVLLSSCTPLPLLLLLPLLLFQLCCSMSSLTSTSTSVYSLLLQNALQIITANSAFCVILQTGCYSITHPASWPSAFSVVHQLWMTSVCVLHTV